MSQRHTDSQLGHMVQLPQDLEPVALLLDRLGEADRSSAPAGFEARIAEASGRELPEAWGAIDALASADRDSASPSLEDRLFLATRATINGARSQRAGAKGSGLPVLARIGAGMQRHALAIAAAVAMAATLGIITAQALRAPAVTPGPDTAGMELAKLTLEDEMEQFFNIIDTGFTHSETEQATAPVAIDDVFDFDALLGEDSL